MFYISGTYLAISLSYGVPSQLPSTGVVLHLTPFASPALAWPGREESKRYKTRLTKLGWVNMLLLSCITDGVQEATDTTALHE